MPTATDALQAAADEMHAATVAMYGVRDEVRAGLTQVKGAATTVITNFLRAGQINYFLDGANGADTNDGLDVSRPMRTPDAILRAIIANGATVFGAVVFMLTDGVIRYNHSVPCPLDFVGAEWGGGALGSPYRPTLRTLSFQTEAMNSPLVGVVRLPPGFRSIAQSVRFTSVNIVMPDVPASFDNKFLFVMLNGGTMIFDGLTLTCATPGSSVSLIASAAPITVNFSGTLGTNAAGKVFAGVAAGGNPAANFNYRTNLTSA